MAPRAVWEFPFKGELGTSLVVQWLRLRAPNVGVGLEFGGGQVQFLGQETRRHVSQLKNPHATTNLAQTNKYFLKQLKEQV